MTVIPTNRGELFSIQVIPEDADGDPIVMDETWGIAAAIALVGSTSGETAITATLYDEGTAWVRHDTIGLPAGTYVVDVRLTNPDGIEFWVEKIRVPIDEPVTKPEPRA